MKKRYFIIIFIFMMFFLTSCHKDIYVVELEMDQAVLDYLGINSTYQIQKNKEFELPTFTEFDYVTYQYHLDDEKYIILKKNHHLSFNGWLDNETNEMLDEKITINKNINATMQFVDDVNTNTVILNLNGGELLATDVNPEFSDIYTLPIPSKEYYVFNGWYTDQKFTSTILTDADFNVQSHYQLYASYQAIASSVADLINTIPAYNELKYTDFDQVKYIYDLYNELSSNDKALVTNVQTLINAYTECISLVNIQNVIDQIDALPSRQQVISTDKYTTDEILALYNDLTPQEQAKVTNYEYFVEIRKCAEEQYDLWSGVASYYDREILKLSIYPSSLDARFIKQMYSLYHNNSSRDSLTPLLKLTDRIDLIYNNLLLVENSTVEYIVNNTSNMSKNVISKEQLFNSFFTDFYHFIIYYYGSSALTDKGIMSLESFLNIASDPNGGGGTNHTGIGNLVCNYLLKKDVNGVVSNQPNSTFIGFCYRNNLYLDVIDFLYNFFAYWRLDEKYANMNNYGADFFAESWAPTVDIAKFFYYDENTSYVKTDRMIDCLTNTAGVVYGMDQTSLPMNLSLRGYKFAGWYLNSDYTGEKVTSLPDTSSGKVVLYAKWEIDFDQQQKDLVSKVEIYIYNLTTTKAIVNSVTIGYARNLYDSITRDYQDKVTNYSSLVELENNY